MKKKMIWVAGILIATSAYAQTDVSTGIMRGKDYGVTYLLPKTEIEIVVQATKHTYMPGEFCKYADRYLRMNNVSADPNTIGPSTKYKHTWREYPIKIMYTSLS